MSSTFKIKRNDTSPAISQQLLDSDGNAVDITGATIKFLMARRGPLKVNGTATIVTAATGMVKYQWVAADTDTVGLYQIEWEVTYSGGGVETFPNEGYNYVHVETDLG